MDQEYYATRPGGRVPDPARAATGRLSGDSLPGVFFELASEGILLVAANDASPAILSANPAAREMLGLPDRGGDTGCAVRLVATAPEAVEVLEGRSASYQGKLLVESGRSTLEIKGVLRPVLISGERAFTVLFEREAERETERRLAAEIEDLTQAVSHDFAAPLRALDGFSRILWEDYSESLDAQGRDYLGRISTASRRMSAMLNGLLQLSRVGRGELRRSRVDLSEVFRLTGDRLAAEARRAGREVEFAVQPGAVVDGDPESLALAVGALLENAFKFTGPRRISRIEFGASPGSEERAYFVRDNGAGFEPEDAGKLFRVFQQLHSRDEYAGYSDGPSPAAGVGLALVRKVVERHGGRVWATGAPDRGASFHFTLREGVAAAADEEGPG